MRLIAIIAFVLAFGPAIFNLAVTGRAVNRPTRTSTSDWALTRSYTLHMGKPSLAILPTGLPVGAVLTESCHNNQDSAVSVWTIYRVTTRRALANIGTFVTNFSGRRLDRQWRYIRGWWRHNSGRAIDEALIVSLYSLPFLAVILAIWRKRILCQRRLEAKRSATLAHPSPILASSIVIRSLVTTDPIQPTQRTEQDIVAIGGASTQLLDRLPRHLAFTFRSRLVVSTPTRNVARSIHQRIIVIALLVLPGGFVIIHYEAVDDLAFWTVTVVFSSGARSSSAVSRRAEDINRVPQRTLTLPTRGLIEAGPQSDVISTCSSTARRLFCPNSLAVPRALLSSRIVRRGGEPLPSHERVAPPTISPKRRSGSASSSFTTIHSIEGVLVMACCSTGNGLHWSIQFYPFQHYHISHQTDNDHDKEELVQADVDIPLPDSPELHGLDHSTRSLDLYRYIAALSHKYLSLRATLVRPLLPEEAKAVRAELRPRLRSLGERARQRRGQEELIQGAASGIEPEAQVVLTPSVDSDDGDEGDEAEEEETEGGDLVEPALVPLPPSRPASPETEEELLRADFFPLADSRPNSPECDALDRSTRRSDLCQYITALSHQYLNLRAMLVRPLLPGEARAIRAEVRPRLGSLGERARERRGLPPPTPVATELEGQVNVQDVVEPVNEQEIVEQVDEGIDGQVNDAEVDGQDHDGEVEISRKKKKPHRGGKKPRTKKHKRQTGKERG